MEILLLLFVPIWLICGVLSAVIAGSKGRSGCGGLLLGLLLGPIGLAVVLLMGKSQERVEAEKSNAADRRPCPACKELMRFDARVCPSCRMEIPAEDVQSAIADRAAVEAEAAQRGKIIAGAIVAALVLMFVSNAIGDWKSAPDEPAIVPAGGESSLKNACPQEVARRFHQISVEGGLLETDGGQVIHVNDDWWQRMDASERDQLVSAIACLRGNGVLDLAPITVKSAATKQVLAADLEPAGR